MNLTLHIVRKDLLRMRVWIACWVALLLLPIGLGALLITNNPFTEQDWDLPNKIAIITGVEVLVGYLLTILVIQDDSVVGTQQFWLTRPISRGRLLCAKALSVIVIVALVPIAVSVPWWLWCGFNAAQIAGAAGETLLVLVLCTLPAALVAVLTDSFSRALLWTLAALAIVMFGGFLFTIATAATVSNWHEESLRVTRVVVAVIAVAVEIAVVVIAQFLLRRRGWWLAAAGVVMALTVVAASRWRWPWYSAEPRQHHVERAAGVNVQFHRAIAWPLPYTKQQGTSPGEVQLERVESQLVVTGIPREMCVWGTASRQRWTWPGGTTVERLEPLDSDFGNRTLFGLETGNPDAETKRSVAGQLQWKTKREFAADEFLAEARAWLPRSLVARMQKEPPKFEARLWWQVVRPELQLEVPLAPGRWTTRNGHGIGIERVERDSDVMKITFVATRPVLLTRMLRAMGEWFRRYELDHEQWWALLDRAEGRVRYMFGERYADKPRWVVVNGVKIEWRTHVWAGPGIVRNGKWTRNPDWKIGTSLAIVTMHEDAAFSREVKVERFEPAN